jgi:hypothetical protein
MYTTSKDTMGKQLGQDIVSGMMEILGLGDIFPDPTQFGLFKIAKALMGLQPGSGSLSGDQGGGDPFMDMLTSLVPGQGNNIADWATQFVPGQGSQGGTAVDNHSFNVNVEGNLDKTTWDLVHSHHTAAMRNLPS